MALDGIVTRAIVHELQGCIGGRISKSISRMAMT